MFLNVLGLYQKILQTDAWERFLRNGDNENNLIALFLKFLKPPESEEYHKYIF